MVDAAYQSVYRPPAGGDGVGAQRTAHRRDAGGRPLHDTVEDTPTTLGDIDSHFGPKVAELVRMLTNVSHAEDGNRFERKNRDRRHSAAASPQAKTIKLADLIDNTRSLLDHDSHFAQTYLIEKQRLLEVLTEGDPTLWRRASHIVEQGLHRLQQPPHNVPASWFEHARRRYRESDAA